LTPLRTITQLQILHGKDFFLYRFIIDYTDITKSFIDY
jgi:hypothetical protein